MKKKPGGTPAAAILAGGISRHHNEAPRVVRYFSAPSGSMALHMTPPSRDHELVEYVNPGLAESIAANVSPEHIAAWSAALAGRRTCGKPSPVDHAELHLEPCARAPGHIGKCRPVR